MGDKRMKAWKAVVCMVVVAAMFVAVREFLVRSEPADAGTGTAVARNIVIVPLTGLPTEYVGMLAAKLKEQHSAGIVVSGAVAKDGRMLMSDSDQYDASFLACVGLEVAQQLQGNNAFVLVLTNEDLNYHRSDLAYVYSVHYGDVAVVSLSRVNDMEPTLVSRLIADSTASDDMQERVLKHLNRGIAYGVYGDEPSLEIFSARHSPVLGPEDVYRVSTCYP